MSVTLISKVESFAAVSTAYSSLSYSYLYCPLSANLTSKGTPSAVIFKSSVFCSDCLTSTSFPVLETFVSVAVLEMVSISLAFSLLSADIFSSLLAEFSSTALETTSIHVGFSFRCQLASCKRKGRY